MTRRMATIPDDECMTIEGEVVLVIPPFASVAGPSLAVHLLQSCAAAQGHKVSVFYSNIHFASHFGEVLHEVLCQGSPLSLHGEQFFAPIVFPGAALAIPSGGPAESAQHPEYFSGSGQRISRQEYAAASARAEAWVDRVAEGLTRNPALRVVGATTTFQQTCGSLALLRAIKRRRPEVVTLLGGANCEGEMVDGLAPLAPWVDCFFSGPSEDSFPAFLTELERERVPRSRIVRGKGVTNLDALPLPCYDEYHAQLRHLLPRSDLAQSGQIWLPYESSRGCWWGAKHHCTFCGLNDETLAFREKSPDRVITELKTLLASHPTPLVSMVDNIMPHSYFRTLLPRLADELPGARIFYEQKANLSFEQLGLLRQAGVCLIQPGIEALSSPLLALMDKGVTAAQNLALLRYARMWRVAVNWNLLYGFPHDRADWYREVLELLPLIPHLEPPGELCRLSIDRFSPYFERPDDYGLRNVRPRAAYHRIFPPGSDTRRIAYHFDADFESESLESPELLAELRESIRRWRSLWQKEGPSAPLLAVTSLGRERFLLLDTRRLPEQPTAEIIDAEQARLVLHGERGERGAARSEVSDWARQRKAVIEREGRLVPLAIAEATTYGQLVQRSRTRPAQLSVLQAG